MFSKFIILTIFYNFTQEPFSYYFIYVYILLNKTVRHSLHKYYTISAPGNGRISYLRTPLPEKITIKSIFKQTYQNHLIEAQKTAKM